MSDFTNMMNDWGQVRDYLNTIPAGDERLSQPIQIVPPMCDYTKPHNLMPAYACGTVKELFHYADGTHDCELRSSQDFLHHPEQLVLCVQASPFDEEGNSSWLMLPDGRVQGDKTGKIEDLFNDSDEN